MGVWAKRRQVLHSKFAVAYGGKLALQTLVRRFSGDGIAGGEPSHMTGSSGSNPNTQPFNSSHLILGSKARETRLAPLKVAGDQPTGSLKNLVCADRPSERLSDAPFVHGRQSVLHGDLTPTASRRPIHPYTNRNILCPLRHQGEPDGAKARRSIYSSLAEQRSCVRQSREEFVAQAPASCCLGKRTREPAMRKCLKSCYARHAALPERSEGIRFQTVLRLNCRRRHAFDGLISMACKAAKDMPIRNMLY